MPRQIQFKRSSQIADVSSAGVALPGNPPAPPLLWGIGCFDGEHEWKFVTAAPAFLSGLIPMGLTGLAMARLPGWRTFQAGTKFRLKRSSQIADISNAGVCLARKSPGPPFVVGHRQF
jgi:hypothetical protein